MDVLDRIPFRPDFEDFFARVRLSACPDLAEEARGLVERAAVVLRPKAVYAPGFIRGRTEDTVDFGVAVFRSRVMSANLRQVERVFFYIATCGRELDVRPGGAGEAGDLLERFWVDTLKEMALEQAVACLQQELKTRYGLEGISSMNPGSGERDLWPLSQQKELFSIFGDVEALIGVRLTEGFLMVPNKSVSGLYFPTDIPFESCQLCTRENCPRRRAPYQGGLPGHP